ncbi:L,D-transpeptidase family protein [Micromonospora sp. WMMD882]|uniref:L,D-transpeptidase family protein n=1 Tax=Micromonospora sp. WMMD882 TaxID=3015151 RepID=UPI00248B517C|nr:L,D-transpeptidase family protein [Micromonospora sp. WMMD882]WBB77863.1 L,D-transpeptidase family protein [Micromonospora sp. WMMD882]
MNAVRSTVWVAALAVVTLVGVGACTPEDPQADRAGADRAPAGVAGRASGAGGSAGADQRDQPTATTSPAKPKATAKPKGTAKPKPTATARPKPTPTVRAAAKRTTPKATKTPSKPKTYAGCPTGEYQKAVETYLARLGGFGTVVVDGRQSATDCAAIKKFQQRYDIRPPEGRAGPTTHDVAKRLATTNVKDCGSTAGSGVTFCIDLTRQTTWVTRDGKVVVAPTVTRTGMKGYATPTGTYKINYRNTKEWSDPYEVWLPYWQRFVGGIGYHQTTTYLHDKSIGSHGCVNLLPVDAKRFWDWGKVGYRVKVFGQRPGT